MKTLLQINSSIYADDGQSTKLATRVVARWRAANPGGQIIVRDLAKDPVPHLDASRFDAFRVAPDERTARQQAVVEYLDTLIAEIVAADVVVLGLPMYNFGVPSMLKAYFDHIARAGVTFRYTAEGAIGLLTGKTVHVLASRGGLHSGTSADTQTPYIRNFLAFLGLTDVHLVYAEGLALGAGPQRESLARAEAQIDTLCPAVTEAA
jgi:FMN-dependent NADH-azoreductase